MIIGSIRSLEKDHLRNGRAFWRINFPELFGRTPVKGLVEARKRRKEQNRSKEAEHVKR